MIRTITESETNGRILDCEPPPYGWGTGRYCLLNRAYVAGLPYYHGYHAIGHIRPGDRLYLAAEPSNTHDRVNRGQSSNDNATCIAFSSIRIVRGSSLRSSPPTNLRLIMIFRRI